MSQQNQKSVVGYLLFRNLHIENANALSGSLIYGTPAITGIKGAFHAMSRKIMTDKATSSMGISLRGVLIASHDYDISASRAEKYRDYNFIQFKSSPSTKTDLIKLNNGVMPSIIQQAYCYMRMSFVVEVVADHKLSDDEKASLTAKAFQQIQHQRIAGGNVRPFSSTKRVLFIEADDLDSISYSLPLCTVLADASDTMNTLLDENPTLTATDILIDCATVHHVPTTNEAGFTEWQANRLTSGHGWVVPIQVGYHGIAGKFEAGLLENSRSNDVDSQYVEAVYSLGRWVNPHQLRLTNRLKSAFWYYNHNAEQSLYLVSAVTPN